MNFQEMLDSEILAIANPIMDNLMQASTQINHEGHVRDFTDRLKGIVTTEHLQRVCEQYQAEKGLFTDREVLAVFKRPDSAAIVWKQYFSKAEGEYVAELVLIHENGRFLVDHTMVF